MSVGFVLEQEERDPKKIGKIEKEKAEQRQKEKDQDRIDQIENEKRRKGN